MWLTKPVDFPYAAASVCLSSTVLVLIKLTKFSVSVRFCCGCGNLIFVFISSFFAIFKNFVHSLEPGETPIYSASHQAPNDVQRSLISQNTLKRCVVVAVRLPLFCQFNNDKHCTVLKRTPLMQYSSRLHHGLCNWHFETMIIISCSRYSLLNGQHPDIKKSPKEKENSRMHIRHLTTWIC